MLLLKNIRLFESHIKVIRNSVRVFHEQYRKGDIKYVKEDNRPKIEIIKHGLSLLKDEVKLWTEEMKEKITSDPKFYSPGDTEIAWTFNSKEDINKWITTADKDNNDGNSTCSFILGKSNKGIFSGYIDKALTKDGTISKTGYCNISAMKARKSFKRETYLDWEMFTHLVFRIRGDGRPYMINLHTAGEYDLQWHDLYSFILYTRGGPYWQIAKLPFSRFFLNSKGRVQDKQFPVPLNRITNLGITCSGKKSGNFSLEIDYIGIYYDGKHNEEFAYEMYQTPKHIVY